MSRTTFGSRVRTEVGLTLAFVFAIVAACGNEQVTSIDARTPVAAPTDRYDGAIGVGAGKLFVFGGHGRINYPEVLKDGAVYDLTTAAWTAIPPAPFSPPLEFPAAAVVGETLAVVGVQCPAVLSGERDERVCEPRAHLAAGLYDLRTGEWQQISLGEGTATSSDPYQLVPRALGVANGSAVFAVHPQAVITIRPAEASFTQLASSPIEPDARCVSDAGLVVVDVTSEEEAEGELDTSVRSFDPSTVRLRLQASTYSWSESRWSPVVAFEGGDAPASFSSFCAGRAMVLVPVTSAHGPSFVLNGSAWRSFASPADDLGAVPKNVWSGSKLVIWGRSKVVSLDLAKGLWQPLPIPAEQRLLTFWTGSDVLIYRPHVIPPVSRVAIPD